MKEKVGFAALVILLMNTACQTLTCEGSPNLSYVNAFDLTPLSFPLNGSGQGLQVIGDKTYLYADTETGSVYEFDENLSSTGWVGRLTVNGEDLIGHPTGIAYKPGYPTFIGAGGMIYQIDWDLFVEDGTLDRALVKTIVDDQARSGTRPEYVLAHGQWLVATSDYDSDLGSELRLMDPDLLSAASQTGESGVIVDRFPVSDFVQDIAWSEALAGLILVQNIETWHGWKFSLVNTDTQEASTVCFPGVTSELEGFATLSNGREVFLTGSSFNNLFISDPLLQGAFP